MQHILISFLFVCHHHHHTHSLIIRRLRQIGLKYKDFSDIVRIGLEVGDTAIQRFDACISKSGPSVLLSPAAEPIRHAHQAIRKSGARMRLITDITTDNMFQCKELMKSFHEVRHLDYVKGHFLVTDSAYDATAAVGENAMAPSYLMFSNMQVFVEQQQCIFDNLWEKAIPAKQRIKEIEQGSKREFIETFRDPPEIQNLTSRVISSATEEICVKFPTANTFRRYERESVIELLTRKANKDGVNIRILLEYDQ
jgi:two-component system, OmpR family, sensor histidine kinase VicK